MDKQKIKIIRKNDEYSAEYQIGDIFQVDSTWYGGANVTSVSGIPLSLDKDEYVLLEEAEKEVPIDHYSYECGVMDCFCEMVASGLKKLAMSHPCDTKAERDSYLPQVKKLCEKYGILYHPQDEALITDLFPAEANQDKYNYLFFRTQDVYETYLELKKRQKELESQLSTLPRQDIARQSIQTNGRIIVTDSLEKAVDAANLIAPEHLELCVEDPFALLPRVKNAGSIFLGRCTPEALGDYFAGPNHTLPTSGTARFSSPLSVDDFVKKSSFLYYTQEALAPVAERIADFARREGLEAHARSALIRTNQGGNPQ